MPTCLFPCYPFLGATNQRGNTLSPGALPWAFLRRLPEVRTMSDLIWNDDHQAPWPSLQFGDLSRELPEHWRLAALADQREAVDKSSESALSTVQQYQTDLRDADRRAWTAAALLLELPALWSVIEAGHTTFDPLVAARRDGWRAEARWQHIQAYLRTARESPGARALDRYRTLVTGHSVAGATAG